MTKDTFKQYINEAVDAMDDRELQLLFPADQQPDLSTIASELIGLRGEVKKFTQSTLKVNHDFQSSVDLNNSRWENILTFISSEKELENKKLVIDEDLRKILFQLIDQNDLLSTTHQQLHALVSPNWRQLQSFKKQMAAWKNGFDITIKRWNTFFKSSGLYITGRAGQQFDPRIHEAVAVVHKPEIPNNQIVETELTGYLFRNQIIRQAKVVVNKVQADEIIGVLTKTPTSKKATNRKRKRKKKRRRK